MKQALTRAWPISIGVVARVAAALGAVAGVAWVVAAVGGAGQAYTHLGYIPVIAAAYAFGAPGGVVIAALAGVALGPAMPLDVASGEAQPTAAWLTRLGFFVLAGYMAGLLFSRLRRQADEIVTLRQRRPAGQSTIMGVPVPPMRHTRPLAGRRNAVSAALLDDLCEAISAERGFGLEFQPVLDLTSGRCVSAEALVRWDHPNHGRILPGRFIPLAEETGLIRPLTEMVITQALAACAGWRRNGIDGRVAINLSARNLVEPGFADRLAQRAAEHGLAPSDIEIEITETAVMGDPTGATEALAQLRRNGHPIAIDDFGTGHSSLAYLKSLPVDAIKIDGAFLRALETDPADALIVRSTLDLAHALGLATVAEGIERPETLHHVRRWGATRAQGNHIARPMSAEAFAAWTARAAA